MEKDNIIRMVKSTCPGINNLSDRTWNEVADALVGIIYREADMKECIVKLFKSISGQIRYDVSSQIKKVIDY